MHLYSFQGSHMT